MSLKNQGIWCETVEKWNPYTQTRHDLFGFIDIVACHPERGILGIQCFTTDWSPHVKKICHEKRDAALAWLVAGGRIELWGWRKVKMAKGKKREVYRPRIGDIELEGTDLVVKERKCSNS